MKPGSWSESLELFRCRPDEIGEVCRLWALSLGIPYEAFEEEMAELGCDDVRVLRHEGAVIGAGRLMVDGQVFGGNSLPTAAIRAVAVAPEFRGQGVGRRLMTLLLEDAYADHLSLAVLYPSDWSFYRLVGFERAGVRHTYEATTGSFAGRGRELTLPAGQESPDRTTADRIRIRQLHLEEGDGRREDVEAILETHRRALRTGCGGLERTNGFFRRWMLGPPDPRRRSWVFEYDGQVEGFLTIDTGAQANQLLVHDACATNPLVARAIGRLVGHHASFFETVSWQGGDDHVLGLIGTDRRLQVTKSSEWMLRIVDLSAALSQRGWTPGVEGMLELDVVDDLQSWNHGPCILEVSNGVGSVIPGGGGSFRIHIGALASLFSGHRTVHDLCRVGAAYGSPEVCAVAARLFSGCGRPSMTESF